MREGRVAVFLIVGLLGLVPLSAEPYRVVAENYPPYEYVEGGYVAGWDYEMVEKAALRAGVELIFEFVPWARADAMVRNGSADAIMSLWQNAERNTYLLFPTTSLSRAQGTILAGPSYGSNPTRLSELSGLVVGLTASNYYGPTFDSQKDLQRVVSPDHVTLLKRLADGTLPLAVMNPFVARYLIQKNNIVGVRFLRIPLDTDNLFIAFSRTSRRGAELEAKLGPALEALQKEGALTALKSHYFDNDAH